MDFKVGNDVVFQIEDHLVRGTIISIAGIFAKVKISDNLYGSRTTLVELSSLRHYRKDRKEAQNKAHNAGTSEAATHYQKAAMQPIEMMQRFLTRKEFIGFLKGNVIKYKARAAFKGSKADDMQKARQYAYWLAMAEAGICIQAERDSVPNDFYAKTTLGIEHNYSDAQLITGGTKQ